MKTMITNLNQVLTFQLEAMYEAVKTLQVKLPIAIKQVSDPELKTLLKSYMENLGDQRLKLKRIFSYVPNGPYDRKSFKMAPAIAPFDELLEKNIGPRLFDIIVVGSLHSTLQYLITSYVDARYIAMRLEVDNVVRLLDEILDLEEDFLQKLRSRSARNVNDACLLVTA